MTDQDGAVGSYLRSSWVKQKEEALRPGVLLPSAMRAGDVGLAFPRLKAGAIVCWRATYALIRVDAAGMDARA